jgi:hypothetical protein
MTTLRNSYKTGELVLHYAGKTSLAERIVLVLSECQWDSCCVFDLDRNKVVIISYVFMKKLNISYEITLHH